MIRSFSTILALLAFISTAWAGSFSGAASGALKEGKLRWPTGRIPIAISASLSEAAANIAPGSDVEAVVVRSLQRWEAAAGIRFDITSSAGESVSPAGRSGDGKSLLTAAATSENMLLFRGELADSPAATRLFYDNQGRITEADIVLNPTQRFSVDGTAGTFDLESVLTHEIGHLLGLDHSPIFGAVMYEHQAANGIFGIGGRVPSVLTDADMAALRAIYGPAESHIECCSEAELRLNVPEAVVWAESNGRVAAAVVSDKSGIATFKGMLPGDYSFFVKAANGNAESLGSIGLAAGDIRSFDAKASRSTGRISLDYVGANGRLYQMPVPVQAGRMHTIFLGGTGIGRSTEIGTNTNGLLVDGTSVREHDYGPGISVISVNVFVSPGTPPGAYSVWVEGKDGSRSYAIGALSVSNASIAHLQP
jgi:hypothetical protein